MTQLKINRLIKSQIDELKLLSTNVPVRFILDEGSFNENELNNLTESKEHIITGQIFPNSNIFKEGAFRIEIKLLINHPFDPPKVCFRTPIYHPNVNENGEFVHELLQKTARWSNSTSLKDIVKAIIDRIDEPDVDYPLDNSIAAEYVENRDEFNRKALELVRKYALLRK